MNTDPIRVYVMSNGVYELGPHRPQGIPNGSYLWNGLGWFIIEDFTSKQIKPEEVPKQILAYRLLAGHN